MEKGALLVGVKTFLDGYDSSWDRLTVRGNRDVIVACARSNACPPEEFSGLLLVQVPKRQGHVSDN